MRLSSLSGLPGASTVSGLLQGIESRVVGALEDVDWVNVAQTVDKSVNAGRIQYKTRRQALRPTVVVTYRGWYADGVAHLTARTIEKPLFNAGELSMGLGSTLPGQPASVHRADDVRRDGAGVDGRRVR